MKHVGLLVAFFTGSTVFAQTSIDTAEYLPIGGIAQYVSIKGKDTTAPVLLFLHGGPGGSVMSYADRFSRKLEEHFVVVHWDQRQTGKTLQKNASATPLTLSVFQDDAYELIQTLGKRFHQKKLYLAAHSWGTVLGFYIAEKYPELIYAYIPIGPMINQLESERMALRMMKDQAMQGHNEKQKQELARVNVPFENGEQLYFHRSWLSQFMGNHRTLSKHYVLNWSATWLAVYNEASKKNLIESLPVIHCPVYFFTGRKDYQTNASITEEYYRKLIAPKKGLYWFEHSGHSVPSSEPQRMQNIIINEILPETLIADKHG